MKIIESIKAFMELKKGTGYYVQGQSEEVDKYYNIWKGNCGWHAYNIYYGDGQVKQAHMKTFNMPKQLARVWANNYANENTDIFVDNDSNDRLQEILKENNFKGKFNNFVESFMALGIGATVVNSENKGIDSKGKFVKSENNNVNIQFVGGRRVYPISVENGEITECAFISYATNGCKIIIHWLNDEGNYVISEYAGSKAKVDYDFKRFSDLKEFDTKTNIPMFQIWHPNLAEEDEIDLNIGTSIFKGSEDVFTQIDMNYTMFYDEFEYGRKMLFLSPAMQEVDANGNVKNYFGPDDAHVRVLPEGQSGENLVTEFNGQLRGQQIIQALNFNMNLAAMNCGLGQSQFEFDSSGGGRPIQTATGVIMKQTELYRNVIKQENFARNNLSKMVQAIAYCNNEFTTNQAINIESINSITIDFDDNIMSDDETRRKEDLDNVSNGLMTIAEYRAKNMGESLEEAQQFVYENALLSDKYLNALQTGAMSPTKYCELVYGTVDQYVVDKMATPVMPNFNDEADDEDVAEEQPREE